MKSTHFAIRLQKVTLSALTHLDTLDFAGSLCRVYVMCPSFARLGLSYSATSWDISLYIIDASVTLSPSPCSSVSVDLRFDN